MPPPGALGGMPPSTVDMALRRSFSAPTIKRASVFSADLSGPVNGGVLGALALGKPPLGPAGGTAAVGLAADCWDSAAIGSPPALFANASFNACNASGSMYLLYH